MGDDTVDPSDWFMDQHESDYQWHKDMERGNAGECPHGHRDGVIPTPWGEPGIRDGLGDWWCPEHETQFGRRFPEVTVLAERLARDRVRAEPRFRRWWVWVLVAGAFVLALASAFGAGVPQ